MFYPGEPAELRLQIEGFLAQAREHALTRGAPSPAHAAKVLVVPHAGTVYSGPVAASAYQALVPRRETIERVVMLGPSHRVALDGVAAPTVDAFSTPLGDVPVDRQAIDAVADLRQLRLDDEPHRREHCLEVNLPFLQLVLGAFALVPLVVGRATAEQVAEIIERLWGGAETLFVLSSDLSHYLSYDEARELDDRTRALVEALDYAHLEDEQACGARPLRGMLLAARNHGLVARCVDLRSSGDTAGSRREVVGYGAFVFS